MSFILDALKKSEAERQRQSVPGLMDPGVVRPRAHLPLWATALIALLAINVLVLLFVVTRNAVVGPKSAAAPATTPGRADQQDRPRADQSAASVPFSPLDRAPVYAPEVPVTSDLPAAPQNSAGRSAATPAPTPAPVPRESVRRDPLLTEQDFKANDEEVLATISEMSLTGAHALPELHLDVHVFATRPSERFVYINMRKYHENAVLQEGPTIERIRRDGVVLDYQGLRFLLPRQ